MRKITRLLIRTVLDLLYLILLVLLLPLLLYRVFVQGKDRETLAERLGGIGHYPPMQNCVWVHGVSVGEIKTAQPLIAELSAKLPENPILVSATSRTGLRLARELYPDCTVVPFPLDFSRAVRRYLDHFAPALVVLLELELWPNFLVAASNRDIPVILVNGRLSEKSYRGYARYLRGLFPVMVANVRRFAMQNETYAERLIRLGIARERVTVTGNMKFDVAIEVSPKARQALRRQCGLASDHFILVGGSTHAPEEKMLIASYRALLPEFPGLRLILVPRQPRRAAEIGQWIREHGFNVIYRSQLPARERNPLAASDVIVGDLMGELVDLYGIAGIAIIGGSLVADGGHNFIEPAALGKAVICGPSMFHFQEAEEFARQGALLQLASADELESALRQLLRSDEKRTGLGVTARRIVEANGGTARRNAALCLDMLCSGLGTSGRIEIAES